MAEARRQRILDLSHAHVPAATICTIVGSRRIWPLSGTRPSGPGPSPDLNPLDFGIWGALEAKVGRVPYQSVEAMKAAVNQEWANMSDDFVQRVCAAFRPRIEKCIEANGSHFE